MLARITGPFKEFGFFAGLVYVADRLLQQCSPRMRLYFYELMVQPIPERSLLPPRLAGLLEIREIGRDEPEMQRVVARPEVMQSRLAQGAICLGAFQKGKFIGYIWFCRRAYEEDEVRCTFVVTPEAESVFDFDLYIFPEHRMGLAFVGIWNGANKFLRERGARYSFSRMTRFNMASRRAHRHLGSKLTGRALFLQAGRLEVMVATVPPYLHCSVTPSRRVRLTLRPDALTA